MALLFAARWGGSVTTAMIAIGVATIPVFIRVIRSGTLQVMNSDYVLAARVAGRRGPGIAVRHVLPNVLGLVIVQASVGYAIAILAEAALSFLGLGAGPTHPVLGPDALRGAVRLADLSAGLASGRRWRSSWPCSGSTCWATDCGTGSTRGWRAGRDQADGGAPVPDDPVLTVSDLCVRAGDSTWSATSRSTSAARSGSG